MSDLDFSNQSTASTLVDATGAPDFSQGSKGSGLDFSQDSSDVVDFGAYSRTGASADKDAAITTVFKGIGRGALETFGTSLVPLDEMRRQNNQKRVEEIAQAQQGLPTVAGGRRVSITGGGKERLNMPTEQYEFSQTVMRNPYIPIEAKMPLIKMAGRVLSGEISPEQIPELAKQFETRYGNEQEWGKAVKDFAANIMPTTEDQQQEWKYKLSHGVGSTVGFLLTRLATGVPGLAMFAGGAGSGEAIEAARAAGASNEEIARAGLWGILPGLTDMLPIEAILRPIAHIPGFKAAVFRYVLTMVRQGAIEGTQEAVQQFMQNAIAKIEYMPERELTEGIAEAGGIGFFVGMLFGAGGAMIETRPGKPKPPAAPVLQGAGGEAAGPVAPGPSAAPILGEEAEAPVTTGQATTPGGITVDVDWVVVEADTLLTSHDDAFNENAEYNQKIQGRDRSRLASREQIVNMAANLDPVRLGDSVDAGSGAPIVSPDGVVESGNARTLAVRRAYNEKLPTANTYRAFLENNGVDTTGFKKPILVRRRLNEMSEQERAAFARDANVSPIADMAQSEKAGADAEALPDVVLGGYKGGDLTNAANRPFIQSLVSSIFPGGERATIYTKNGALSQDGLRRVENALFAKAYDNTATLETLRETLDVRIKSIGNALVKAAPGWAQLRAAIAGGEADPSFDITPSLMQAVAMVQEAQAKDLTLAELLQQEDMFAEQDPVAVALLRMMYPSENMKRPLSADKIAAKLTKYAEEVRKEGQVGLDLGMEAVTPEAILAQLTTEEAGQVDLDFSDQSTPVEMAPILAVEEGMTVEPTPAPVEEVAPADKPLAAEGLESYRYKSPYGWINIGANSVEEALTEAARSTNAEITVEGLQQWDGTQYVDVEQAPAPAAPSMDTRPVDVEGEYADKKAHMKAWVKQSKADGGNLSQIDPYVENLRGARIESLWSGEQGTVKTVSNEKEVVVEWDEGYTRDLTDGQDWLARREHTDYRIIEQPEAAPAFELTPTEEVAPVEEAPVDKKAVTTAKRLRNIADKMETQIEGKMNSGVSQQNPTRRRIRIAEGMRTDGLAMKDTQTKLRALADAIEDGTVPPILAKATSRAAVEQIKHGYFPTGKWAIPQDIKRLQKAGINDQAQLDEAKAALDALGTFELTAEEQRAQKLKDLENSLVGSKIPGFFATPPGVAKAMVEAADIKPGEKVLEPSAGSGVIADAIKEGQPEANLDTVERNGTLRNVLEVKGHKLVGGDFLEHEGEYDKILMNPPFEKTQDIDHVRHAFNLLKPGGRLVAIMSEGTFYNTHKKQAEFRDWMEENGGYVDEKLANGTFERSGTGVASRIIVMDKAGGGAVSDFMADERGTLDLGALLGVFAADESGGLRLDGVQRQIVRLSKQWRDVHKEMKALKVSTPEGEARWDELQKQSRPMYDKLEALTGHPMGLNDVETRARYQNGETKVDRELTTAAIEEFGLSDHWDEIGYIMDGGETLDFSGKNEDPYNAGRRLLDHRQLGDLVDGGETGTDDMTEFMRRTGAVRVVGNGFDITNVPSDEQLNRMEDAALWWDDRPLHLDASDPKTGNHIKSATIHEPTAAAIEAFYNGAFPGTGAGMKMVKAFLADESGALKGDEEALPTTPPPIPVEGVIELGVKGAVHDRVVKAAGELLMSGKVPRDEHRMISDQIMELLQTDRLADEELNETLNRNHITHKQFADEMWRKGVVRHAAHTLGMLGALESKLKRAAKAELSDEEYKALKAAGLDEGPRGQAWWQRASNIWRASLVVQLATAMRNFESQVARVGIDVFENQLDRALVKMFNKKGTKGPHPIDAMGLVSRVFFPRKLAGKMTQKTWGQTKADVDKILAAFPKIYDRMFMRYHSDIDVPVAQKDALGKAETIVGLMNTANRFQEFTVRRAVFQTELARLMAENGMDLVEAIEKNETGAIPLEMLEASVDKALETTWAANFSPMAPGAEGIAGQIIRTLGKIPLAHHLAPFPRFFFNSLKFQFEFSPAGMLKLLSAEERAKIAGGDMKVMSRAIIGTALLGAAYMLRDSEWAGERWYEVKLEDGRTIDIRPFNPFASYFFVADIVIRARDDNLHSLTSKDIAMGVFSSQLRAGSGLYIVDSMLKEITGGNDVEKALHFVQRLGGEVASGYFTWFNQIRDFLAPFDEQLSIVRDREQNPFFAPIFDKLPFMQELLPETQSPTRAAPYVREETVLRQMTGITVKGKKNPVESELDRLGMKRGEWRSSLGDPKANYLMDKHLGPMVEKYGTRFVESAWYSNPETSDRMKAWKLQSFLRSLRPKAVKLARAEDRKLFAKLDGKKPGLREELALEELLGQPFSEFLMERVPE